MFSLNGAIMDNISVEDRKNRGSIIEKPGNPKNNDTGRTYFLFIFS
jgi:hypothetical protein